MASNETKTNGYNLSHENLHDEDKYAGARTHPRSYGKKIVNPD